jgi:hypothetical protein
VDPFWSCKWTHKQLVLCLFTLIWYFQPDPNSVPSRSLNGANDVSTSVHTVIILIFLLINKIDKGEAESRGMLVTNRPTNYLTSISHSLCLCVTWAFGDRPRRMLWIIQRFGKHYSCHRQGESVGMCFFKASPGWRWQLQCFPKRWIILSIRHGLSPKAEVTHWTPAAKTWGQASVYVLTSISQKPCIVLQISLCMLIDGLDALCPIQFAIKYS